MIFHTICMIVGQINNFTLVFLQVKIWISSFSPLNIHFIVNSDGQIRTYDGPTRTDSNDCLKTTVSYPSMPIKLEMSPLTWIEVHSLTQVGIVDLPFTSSKRPSLPVHSDPYWSVATFERWNCRFWPKANSELKQSLKSIDLRYNSNQLLFLNIIIIEKS